MLLTEDKLAQWVQSKDGLLITRSILNVNNYNVGTILEPKYVCITGYTNIINKFFDEIIQYFNKGIVLIIIESDVVNITKKQLEHINILHCFTWNKPFQHEKMSSIPIGLNYNRQYNIIDNWLKQNNHLLLPSRLLCLNYSLNTDSSRQILSNKAKQNWHNFCSLLSYVPSLTSYILPSNIEGKIQIHVTNPECYNQWRDFKFILSPRGAGIDCHRTWEVLAIGRIPIVLSSSIDELYKDLPVVIVNSWDEINEEFLQEQYQLYIQNIQKDKYNMDKLSLEYWTNQIESKILSKKTCIHFSTYGNHVFEKAKNRLLNEANMFGEFSNVKGYGPDDLPSDFKNKYKEILNMPRGGGYWIWRPIIINHALENMQEGEYLVYLDAGCTLNIQGKKRFYEYIHRLKNSKYGVLSFQMSGKTGPGSLEIEKKWTIKEIFDLFNVSVDSDIANSGQLLGGVLIMKKNKHLMNYMQEYTNIILNNSKLCTDYYNDKQQLKDFKENRHEQSITSILRKKNGSVIIDSDESWMVPFGQGESLKYPFWATRRKN